MLPERLNQIFGIGVIYVVEKKGLFLVLAAGRPGRGHGRKPLEQGREQTLGVGQHSLNARRDLGDQLILGVFLAQAPIQVVKHEIGS